MGGLAVLVIDMLNDFIIEGAVLEVPCGRRIAPNISRLLEEARKRGVPVIYICDSHRKDDDEFRLWPPHAIEGTMGADVIDELKPREGDVVVRKRRYSGFVGTDLELTLREAKARKLVMTGVLTDVCVLLTAVEAYMRGYEVYLVKDCVATLSDARQEWAIKYVESIARARTLTSEEAISLIGCRAFR